jgi:hypothetical protein
MIVCEGLEEPFFLHLDLYLALCGLDRIFSLLLRRRRRARKQQDNSDDGDTRFHAWRSISENVCRVPIGSGAISGGSDLQTLRRLDAFYKICGALEGEFGTLSSARSGWWLSENRDAAEGCSWGSKFLRR